MDKELRDYVREQARNRVSPNVLRHNLINRGWSLPDEEQAITQEYSRSGIPLFVGGILLFVVAFLVILVLSLLNKSPGPDFYEPSQIGSNDSNVNLNSNISDVEAGCLNVSDSLEKDACYLNYVKEGKDCDVLDNDTEMNFCYRALEYNLLSE